MSKRFELRKSPVDGKWRRWEERWASSLGMVDQEEADMVPNADYKVQVVTAVYDRRKDAFPKRRAAA